MFEVVEVHMGPSKIDESGLVQEGAFLILKGLLVRIVLNALELKTSERYGWCPAHLAPVSSRRFTNVYLDSPSSDIVSSIAAGPDYCVNAQKNPGGYLVCLLLRFDAATQMFTRLGLSRVTPFDAHGELLLLHPVACPEINIPGCEWDSNAKKHVFGLS